MCFDGHEAFNALARFQFDIIFYSSILLQFILIHFFDKGKISINRGDRLIFFYDNE